MFLIIGMGNSVCHAQEDDEVNTDDNDISETENTGIDFDGREDYYIEYCNFSDLSELDGEVCKQFNKYLEDKNAETTSMIEDLNSKEEEINKNIEDYLPVLYDYQQQIADADERIAKLEEALKELGGDIDVSTDKIIELSNSIQKITDIQKAREDLMVGNMYGTSKITQYTIEDYEEQIRSAIDVFLNQLEMTIEEQKKIDEAQKGIAKAEDERQQVAEEFDRINTVKKQINDEKATVEQLKTATQKIITAYKQQKADIESAKNAYMEDIEQAKANMKLIAEALGQMEASDGFENLVKGSYISAGTWSYPEGGTHLGVDYAANIGNSVTAPANGVVLYVADSCANDGYIGNMCGAPGIPGGGNQMYIAVNVKGKIYTMKILHLNSGSLLPAGTKFKQGDKLAEVGNSGNSTGPHTHVEVYQTPYDDIQAFIESWDMDLTFGTGLGTLGLEGRCLVKKEGICRMDPMTVFNITVGKQIE